MVFLRIGDLDTKDTKELSRAQRDHHVRVVSGQLSPSQGERPHLISDFQPRELRGG